MSAADCQGINVVPCPGGCGGCRVLARRENAQAQALDTCTCHPDERLKHEVDITLRGGPLDGRVWPVLIFMPIPVGAFPSTIQVCIGPAATGSGLTDT